MKGVIVIDVAGWLHRWRRRLWKFFGCEAEGHQCRTCGAALTAIEREYYGSTCGRCEALDWRDYLAGEAKEQQ